MINTGTKGFYTLDEARRRLGYKTTKPVVRKIRQGLIRCFPRTAGQGYRIPTEEIDNFGRDAA